MKLMKHTTSPVIVPYICRMQRSDRLVHHLNSVIISPPSLLSSPLLSSPLHLLLLPLLLLHTLPTNQHSFPAAIHPSIHLPAHTNPNTTTQTKSKPPPPRRPQHKQLYTIFHTPYFLFFYRTSTISPQTSRGHHIQGEKAVRAAAVVCCPRRNRTTNESTYLPTLYC